MKILTIGVNDAGQRADKFVSKCLPALPASLMQKYFRLKRIKVNGKRCAPSDRLNEGDELSLYINDEFFGAPSYDEYLEIEPQLSVAYEDQNILVADKPRGQLCHDSETEKRNTLINHITAYLYRKGEYAPAKENSFAPALCNRIDRNTEGLVIAAKNAESLRIINEMIKQHRIKKTYRMVVVGRPPQNSGVIDNYIEKDEAQNRVFVHARKTGGAKRAVTRYRLLKTNGDLSLVEAELETGRTHQIRAQMSYVGCPLLGDGKYGDNAANKKYRRFKQVLQSYSICFEFENGGEKLSYLENKTIKCKRPLDFDNI